MKICKSLLIGVLFVAGISFVSCGSTKKAEENVTETQAPEEITEASESIENEADSQSEQNSDASENAEDSESTEASEVSNVPPHPGTTVVTNKMKKKKEKKNKDKKNYTGWIDIPVRDVDLKSGNLRLKTKTKLGSYNISVLSEDGKYIPVLSTANEYTGSYYALKVDKKIYKLTADSNTQTRARKNDDGNSVSMFYIIENVADVQIDYNFLSSSSKTDKDMIKVVATVTNTGTKKAEFTLKSILDTVLGESTQHHFYTSEKVPVKSEVMYRTMQNEKWFLSQNNNVKMQLLFDGADISKIDYVALANYVTLDIKSWEPEMLAYRAFDTVLSYNNSAVGIAWPTAKMGVGEKVTYVYYMAFSTGVEAPQGAEYIYSSSENVPVVEEVELVVPEVKVPEVTEIITAESVQPEQPPLVVANEPEVPKIVSNVQFDVSKLTKEQLSPEYIQNLLDRIAALEEDDKTINRDELLQLNSELDAILEVLRQ